MPRQALQPDGMAAPKPPFSPVVVSGDLVYTAGQVAHDAEGSLVAGGIEEQTRQTLENVRACLEAAGCTLDDVHEGERVPRRPRRLRRLQPRLPRVLRRAVSRAHERPGRACPPACSSRSRRSPAGAHDRATSSATASSRPTRSGRAARGWRSASSSTTRRAASGRRSRATPSPSRICTRSSARRRRSAGATSTPSRCSSSAAARASGASTASSASHDLPLTVYAVAPGARAQPGGRASDGRRRLGGGEPRLALDRLPGCVRGGRARRHATRDRDHRAGLRAAAGGLVHGPGLGGDATAGRRGGRLPLRLRLVRRRASLLGRGRPGASTSSSRTRSMRTTSSSSSRTASSRPRTSTTTSSTRSSGSTRRAAG